MRQNLFFQKNATPDDLRIAWILNIFTVSQAWEFSIGSSSFPSREARASPSGFPIWRLGTSATVKYYPSCLAEVRHSFLLGIRRRPE